MGRKGQRFFARRSARETGTLALFLNADETDAISCARARGEPGRLDRGLVLQLRPKKGTRPSSSGFYTSLSGRCVAFARAHDCGSRGLEFSYLQASNASTTETRKKQVRAGELRKEPCEATRDQDAAVQIGRHLRAKLGTRAKFPTLPQHEHARDET